MSVTLDLPEELESDLSTEAARLGLSLPEYILRLLAASRAAMRTLETGAELIEYWQSEKLIGTRPDMTDSQTHARQIRNQVERRLR